MLEENTNTQRGKSLTQYDPQSRNHKIYHNNMFIEINCFNLYGKTQVTFKWVTKKSDCIMYNRQASFPYLLNIRRYKKPKNLVGKLENM